MKREEKQSEQTQGNNHTAYLGRCQSSLWTEKRREGKAGLEDRKDLESHCLPLPRCQMSSTEPKASGPPALP